MGTHRATRSVTHAHASGGGNVAWRAALTVGEERARGTNRRKRERHADRERRRDTARSAQARCSPVGMYPREMYGKYVRTG